MVETTVEFYFDVGSPASYIAHKRLRKGFLEGYKIEWKPILVGGLLQATGNKPPTDVPAKRAWMEGDMQRCAARENIPFMWNQAFPVNTLFFMRAATALVGQPSFLPLVDTLFDALWARNIDLSKPELRDATLKEAGFDPAEISALAANESVKARLKAETETLAQRGGFGVPTFFVGDEMFFGQDRMDFVAEVARGDQL